MNLQINDRADKKVTLFIHVYTFLDKEESDIFISPCCCKMLLKNKKGLELVHYFQRSPFSDKAHLLHWECDTGDEQYICR